MHEIVITGYGIKAPGVFNKLDFLSVLKNGICTQSVTKSPNGEEMVAGVIEGDFLEINEKNYKRYPRSARLAMAAALDAVEMSNTKNYQSQRIAVILGSAAGAILEIEQGAHLFNHVQDLPIHGVTLADANTLSNAVAEIVGSSGPTFTISTGCTASIDALIMAKSLLESNTVDACIVGGADAPLGQWTINGFKKTRGISSETKINKAGVPFSKKHNGFVLSEGAGIIVLERNETAKEKGKKVYGKLEKVVSRNEAIGLLKSDTTGEHMLGVFQEAVEGFSPSYLNSQALGLKLNDEVERFIHEKTFRNPVPITSIKRDDRAYVWSNGSRSNYFLSPIDGIRIYSANHQNNGRWI